MKKKFFFRNVMRIELSVIFSKNIYGQQWITWIKSTVATYWWGELVSFGLCCCYSVKFTQADLCLGKYLYSLIEKKFGLIYYETHDLFYFPWGPLLGFEHADDTWVSFSFNQIKSAFVSTRQLKRQVGYYTL